MDSFAQHGEDLMIAERFSGRPGVFVEVGAYNGIDLSNTWLLERDYGWTGVLVEPSPHQADACRKARSCHVAEAAAVSPQQVGTALLHVTEDAEAYSSLGMGGMILHALGPETPLRTIEVPARTLDEILKEVGTHRIDLLTVDVEGFELDVMRGATLSRLRPKIVLLERNDRWPDWPVLCHMARSGYGYRATVGLINDWYEPGHTVLGVLRMLLTTALRAARLLGRRLKAAGLRSLKALQRPLLQRSSEAVVTCWACPGGALPLVWGAAQTTGGGLPG